MRVILLFVVGLALVAAMSPPRFVSRRRAAGSWSGDKYTCGDIVPAGDNGEGFPPSGGTKAQWQSPSWYYKKDVVNSRTGEKYKGDKSDGEKLPKGVDMCKIRPEMCKHDGTNDFCIKTHAAACCPEKAVGVVSCEASGFPRKYMPQLVDKRFAKPTPEPNSLAESYNKLKAWARTYGGWGSFDYEDKEVNVADLMPTQDEIFWTKSINKCCYDPTLTTPRSPPSGDPADLPFVGSDNYIIDGHHRWSQAALCPFVKDSTGKDCTMAKAGKINVKSTKGATGQQLVDKLTQWSKGAWVGKGGSNQIIMKDGAADGLTGADMITFDAFIETAARTAETVFGRTAHKSKAEAKAHYVALSRSAMEDIGLELKGGDEAWADLFEIHYAPKLWN